MKKITAFSVNYPVTIMMLILAVLLLGYISFDKLGVDLFPELNNPRIYVEIKQGERPPEEIEKEYVESIESLAIRQKNVTEVSSICRVGSAQITVEYQWDTDMDEAFLDLQRSFANFSQNSDLDELNLSQHDPNSTPIMLVAFLHPQITDMDELRQTAENYIRNELIRQEGIAAVEIIGAEEKEVLIVTDPYRLAAHDLTLESLAAQIQSGSITASGGSIVEKGRRYIIRSIGEFASVDEVGSVIVGRKPANNSSGLFAENASSDTTTMVPIYLRDVANISMVNKDPQNIVRADGQRCVSLAIYKETRFNTVKAVEQLDESLETVRKALPGYELRVINNQGTFIEDAIDEVEETALLGILLAIIILYVFLRRVGVTLIMSVAIPISIIATFNLMYFNGLTLNIMTLGGLALGAGMLVDNAIIVMENIFRHMEGGASLKDAAIMGAAEVGGAITASTITTIIVFLPIVYLHGAAGELFKEQAWTVAFSLIASLAVAILVIPMLCSRFLGTPKNETGFKSIQVPAYASFLEKVLNHRYLVLIGAAVLVGVGYLLLPIVGSEFVPRPEGNVFRMQLKLPEGAALSFTDNVVQDVERVVRESLGDNLKSIYAQTGPSTGLENSGIAFFEGENSATLTITLSEARSGQLDATIERIGKLFRDHDELEVGFLREESALQTSLGTGEAPLTVEIKGEDLDILQALTVQAVGALEGVGDIRSVESSFDEGRPEVNIVVDRVLAGIANISMESVSSQLRDRLEGKDAGEFEQKGEPRDIRVELPDLRADDLSMIEIDAGSRKIRLNELARIAPAIAPKEIYRKNQNRVARVALQLRGEMPLDHVVANINAALEELPYPPRYGYEISGEEQKRAESFGNLRFALLLSIALIYMVLASQFESLVHPFTILLTIPLAAVGAILLFFLIGKPLNIMAYIGIVMLVGIAVNDSIILVDAINQLKRSGLELKEAILTAGQRRFRPIIMTSLTTILALLPLTIGFGESAALRAPMALAVIGGLVTSTMLTLVVIPTVYMTLDKFTVSSERGAYK